MAPTFADKCREAIVNYIRSGTAFVVTDDFEGNRIGEIVSGGRAAIGLHTPQPSTLEEMRAIASTISNLDNTLSANYSGEVFSNCAIHVEVESDLNLQLTRVSCTFYSIL